MQKQFSLTKSGDYSNTRVKLVNDWAREGQRYNRNMLLPGTRGKDGREMTAGDFVREKLLERGPSELDLGCDEPDQLVPWGWLFVTYDLPPEWFKLAELHHELVDRGHKLPAIEEGQSIYARETPFAMHG
jgi:hypothetical protein